MLTSHAAWRSRLITTLVCVLVAGLLLTACGNHQKLPPLEPATQRVAEAEQLISDVANAVSPGATVSYPDSGGWDACTKPFKGQAYQGLFAVFSAPAGKTGADLAPALIQQFKNHGFTVDPYVNTLGDHIDFIGSSDYTGFHVNAYKYSRRVDISIDSQCGIPPSGAYVAPDPFGFL